MSSIYLPQYKDRIITPPRFRAQIGGRFLRMECFQGIKLGSGRVLEIAGTRHIVNHGFDNLILNQGLDHKGSWATNGINEVCQIGVGTDAELITDTALQTWERNDDGREDISVDTQGSPPYYASNITTFRFDPPGSNKVYSEIGISPFGTGNGNLMSRALIKDGGGSPDTIAVLANEWLDVVYELRLYVDHLTVSNATVSGFDLDILASAVTLEGPLAWTGGVGNDARATYAVSYSGDASLGPVTGSPSSASGTANDAALSRASYSTTTYQRSLSYSYGLNDANYPAAPAGIGAIVFWTSLGLYQVLFDPPIPKTSSDTLVIDVSVSWTRKVIP